MSQAVPWFAQTEIGGVKLRVTLLGLKLGRSFGAVDAVGVNFAGAGEKFLFQRISVQPGAAWFIEQGEEVGHPRFTR